MPINFSRRSFLSTGAKTAAAVVIYSSIETKGATVLVNSVVPREASTQAAAMQPWLAQLDRYIARHMRETGAPGLTLALANRDGLVRVSTYGFADTKAGLRVVPETMFEIGSISKSFVSLALLQAREEGKLDLSKPVVEYLPWLKINSKFEPVTTHHILSHTAGLPGVPLLLDAMLSDLWTGYAPGNKFLYSNTGYNILGFLLETIDKRPFGDSIRARLLEPLGMTATSPMITNNTREKMAVGYEPINETSPYPLHGTLAEAEWLEMDMAAGSIASTPGDMSKYIRMLVNHGALPKGRLISEETFNLFVKPAVKSPFRGEDASYGYGLWVSDIEGHTRLRHTGGMVAFSSSIDADVTSGVGAFASVNANLRGYRPVAVTKFAVELMNASLSGKTLPAAPDPPPPPTEVKNALEYVGVFTSAEGKTLEFKAEGDKLILVHKSKQIILERSGRDQFLVKDPEFDMYFLGFAREGGKVTEAFHGSNWYAGTNYAGPRTFTPPKEWQGFVGHYHNDSPWYGDSRIVLRKDKLYVDGVQPLVPRSDGKFGINDPEAPDWIEFESIINGRAMRLNLSGVFFRRTFTP
ncbi:MAG TPA: serine hydrolase domain-containing protein [Pyrinomonadaceae bacterium]|jgi:Beta-lactamase class C and other penicillin binding proteins|nr:serine hydrolase domain-containing protein [Pyrinomonadaceae bacterium]